MDDDLFWQIACDRNIGTDTTWIVPNDDDLIIETNRSVPFSRTLHKGHSHCDCSYSVNFQEVIQSSGVLSKIGGEVWEASLLLCAYLVLNEDHILNKVFKNSINPCLMELGSGVGLPGLLMAELVARRYVLGSLYSSVLLIKNCVTYRLVNTKSSCDRAAIVLTDFDNDLLENLCSNGELNEFIPRCAQNGGDASGGLSSPDSVPVPLSLEVQYLNWFDYYNASEVHSTLHSHWRGAVDFMFGSALVYSPSHCAVGDVIQ